MFSSIFLTLFLSVFICKPGCAFSNPSESHKRPKENALELVLEKYISPLRQLTAELPNHAIEMQIEFFDQAPKPSSLLVPQRRLIGVSNRQLKKLARTADDTSQSATPKPDVSSTTASSTKPSERPTKAEVSTSKTSDAPSGSTPDLSRKPVYMEDLNKALSDFEKKLQATTPISETTSFKATSRTLSKLSNTESGTVKSIDDILQLLKKAVQLERHIPQPNDDNLDWVQIKIPRDI